MKWTLKPIASPLLAPSLLTLPTLFLNYLLTYLICLTSVHVLRYFKGRNFNGILYFDSVEVNNDDLTTPKAELIVLSNQGIRNEPIRASNVMRDRITLLCIYLTSKIDINHLKGILIYTVLQAILDRAVETEMETGVEMLYSEVTESVLKRAVTEKENVMLAYIVLINKALKTLKKMDNVQVVDGLNPYMKVDEHFLQSPLLLVFAVMIIIGILTILVIILGYKLRRKSSKEDNLMVTPVKKISAEDRMNSPPPELIITPR